MEYDEVFKRVLKEINPKQSEIKKANQVSIELKKILEKSAKELKIDCEIFLGGSIAKGTWLSGKHDIDFFIRLNSKYNDLSQYAGMVISNALSTKNSKFIISKVHGSRDYYKMDYRGFEVEFVPVLKISKVSDFLNITDASPFHVKYVQKELKKNPKLKEEILLLKQFSKANGFYGAETWISGFSGYVTELLILHYGSFFNLLKSALGWKGKIYIDTKKYYKSLGEAIKKLDKSKTRGPLVLIDPVQKERNAGASINQKALDKFINSAEKFLEKPLENMFKKEKITIKDLEKTAESNNHELIYLVYKIKSKAKKDVFFAKMQRNLRKFSAFIEKENVKVYNKGILPSETNLYLWLETEKITSLKPYVQIGPSETRKDAVKNFNLKWKNHPRTIKGPYIKDGKVCFDVKPRYRILDTLIKEAKKFSNL
ncbi:MAG: CCA tRNA nucleotidyltransferase [Candidatus Nanoarchaeia archaeon]|nr:CCA tRNA nucleotidyltransferase [Candidatus Nanoarchaeia archaeon]